MTRASGCSSQRKIERNLVEISLAEFFVKRDSISVELKKFTIATYRQTFKSLRINFLSRAINLEECVRWWKPANDIVLSIVTRVITYY